MSAKAGTLLWNRVHVTFPPNVSTVDVDTGIKQVNKSFADQSPNEPDLGQRLQIIPEAPRNSWNSIQVSEPTLDPVTGTLHVTFTGPHPEGSFQLPAINVLFWDPHTVAGPGDADTYNPPQ